MARESSDPDQVSYFADPDDQTPMPPPLDIVIGGPKQAPTVPDTPRTPTDLVAERNAARDRRAGEIATSSLPQAPPQPPRERERVEPKPGDDPASELRRQLDQQRGLTERANRAAEQAMQRAAMAERNAGQANVHMVGSAIEAAERASQQAKDRFQACLDAGDHRGAADAQIALSDSRANLLRLQEQKAIIEEEARQPRQQPQPPPQGAPQFDAASARANIIAELQRTGYDRSARWVSDHPEWTASREQINRVDGAHGYAVNNLGLRIDSDEYFAKMEELLGMRNPPQQRQNFQEPRAQREGARPAAPVNPGAPSYRTGESRQMQVHLTSEQRHFARDVLGMTDEEYAEELARSYNEGKLLQTRLS
jgi:hypothetical protein